MASHSKILSCINVLGEHVNETIMNLFAIVLAEGNSSWFQEKVFVNCSYLRAWVCHATLAHINRVPTKYIFLW